MSQTRVAICAWCSRGSEEYNLSLVGFFFFGHRVRAERVLLNLSFYAVVKVQKSAICPWWFVWSEGES